MKVLCDKVTSVFLGIKKLCDSIFDCLPGRCEAPRGVFLKKVDEEFGNMTKMS